MIKTGQLSVFISNTLDLTGNATENKHYFCAAVCVGAVRASWPVSAVSLCPGVFFIHLEAGGQPGCPATQLQLKPAKDKKQNKTQRSYYLWLYWHLVVENVCTWSTKHDVRAFLFWEFSIQTGPTQVELGGAQRPDAGGGNSTTLTPFNCLSILILNIILLDQAALTTIACIIHAHIFTYIEHVGIKYYVHWEEEVKWHFYTELFPSAQITIHFIQSHTHLYTASVFSSFLKLFIYGAHTYT